MNYQWRTAYLHQYLYFPRSLLFSRESRFSRDSLPMFDLLCKDVVIVVAIPGLLRVLEYTRNNEGIKTAWRILDRVWQCWELHLYYWRKSYYQKPSILLAILNLSLQCSENLMLDAVVIDAKIVNSLYCFEFNAVHLILYFLVLLYICKMLHVFDIKELSYLTDHYDFFIRSNCRLIL